mmetsp:Transcript_11037/g.13053  ORF Transcript_11037/g.13053 Transcript_11037/m.13053 type:complete len:157 (-) Transcript_11037:61-531(-)
MQSRLLLAKLPPLKSIMCIIQSQEGTLGTALSDPYLGFATPLASIPTITEVEKLIQEHKPGGLLFGLPVATSSKATTCSASRILRDKIMLSHGWSGLLTCSIDEQLTLEEAIRRKETEWEMWEDIDLSDGEASTEAAVALNGWLWDHCGGWRNTFG